MAAEWPSKLALEMLEELEREPTDCGSIDLDELLSEWGIVEVLPGQGQLGYRTRTHPRAPNFYFHYPLKAELGPGTVRRICSAVRSLYRILEK